MTDRLPAPRADRRPRLALMGEFSAGKSTLANLLLGQAASPVKVTATQLPPIWYRCGPAAARRVPRAGPPEALAPGDWSAAALSDTARVEVSLEAEVLEACDLIDMPGTSDPNMAPDHWAEILPEVDMVIWCTTATQAWRRSEAALWAGVPDRLKGRSLLLVTRMDTIRRPEDRARILRRLRSETEGGFAQVLPISLTQALAGRDDDEALEAAGAGALVRSLDALLAGEALAVTEAAPEPGPEPPPDSAPAAPVVRPRRVVRRVTAPGCR